jgi:hypothetical protein
MMQLKINKKFTKNQEQKVEIKKIKIKTEIKIKILNGQRDF